MERPEVIINVASSLDGVIASNVGALNLSTTEDWIRVHELRNSVDAILVGITTIMKDDPQLSIRHVTPKKPHPFRVVLDSTCKIPLNSRVLKNTEEFPSLVITSKNASKEKIAKLNDLGVTTLTVSKMASSTYLDLEEILMKLKQELKIERLLIEGGSKILTQFLKLKLVDKMHIFYSSVFAGTKKAIQLYDDDVVTDIDAALKFQIDQIKEVKSGFVITLKPE